jgi:ABC-type glutathione transport system ATPase component
MPPTVSQSSAVQVRGVTRDFGSGDAATRALRGVDLDIPHGELLMLVGPSGCGKTTLARMLMNVLEPTSGEILYDGRPASERPPEERSRKLQAVFQDPYSSLNPRMTVGQTLAEPLRLHGLHGGHVLQRHGRNACERLHAVLDGLL